MALNWIDCHVHVLNGGIEELQRLRLDQKVYGYAASNFLSVEGMDDAAQNALGIAFKLLDPVHYAFGGLHYRFQYDFAEEVRRLWEIGFDGIKMIENKPTERKRLGYAQDDARYDGLYRRAAELDMPMLIHVSDPRNFWDPELAPAWAVAAGYAYADGSFVSFDQLFLETVHMLEKHPNLRVCLAHLFFLSDDEKTLRSLMDRFPKLRLDITAGTEMYYEFTRRPELWRRFFLDYQDRIFYGTDNCNPATLEDLRIRDDINALERRFLTENCLFPLWEDQIRGVGLPREALEKITAENFRRFTSETPRPLDRGRALEYLQERLAQKAFRLSEREAGLIKAVCGLLEKT